MKALKFNSGRLIYFLMYKNEIIYKLYRAQDLFWKKQITKIKNMFFHISWGLCTYVHILLVAYPMFIRVSEVKINTWHSSAQRTKVTILFYQTDITDSHSLNFCEACKHGFPDCILVGIWSREAVAASFSSQTGSFHSQLSLQARSTNQHYLLAKYANRTRNFSPVWGRGGDL